MEGVRAGTALLAGNEYDKIWQAFTAIMDNDLVYQQMSKAVNPYGDGKTAQRVFDILKKY
jgi:UDP-N-acetylglucosamine 2-epimerase (non-hydrolysing)